MGTRYQVRRIGKYVAIKINQPDQLFKAGVIRYTSYPNYELSGAVPTIISANYIVGTSYIRHEVVLVKGTCLN